MSKLTKLISIFTIAISILALTTCGPSKEEQYNTLKQETLKMAAEIPALYKKPKEISTKMNFDRSITKQVAIATDVKNFKEANNKGREELPSSIAKVMDNTIRVDYRDIRQERGRCTTEVANRL